MKARMRNDEAIAIVHNQVVIQDNVHIYNAGAISWYVLFASTQLLFNVLTHVQ